MSATSVFHPFTLFLAHILCFQRPVGAAPTGSPSGDGTDRLVPWQPNPTRRGTLNIVESCLFTILICTWSTLRLNLPSSRDSRIRWMLRHLLWTFMNVLMPELTLALTIQHRSWVKNTLKELGETYPIEDRGSRWWKVCEWPHAFKEWAGYIPTDNDSAITLKHCYYGNMGGFLIMPPKEYLKNISNPDEIQGMVVTFETLISLLEHEASSSPEGTLDGTAIGKSGQIAAMKSLGLKSKASGSEGNDADEKSYGPTNKASIDHILERIKMTKAEIEDKDNGNVIATTVAVLQLFWLGFSLCTRVSRRLATSQLEVLTFSFVLCAFVTFFVNWSKPYDIRMATKVHMKSSQKNYNRIVSTASTLPRFGDLFRCGAWQRKDFESRFRNDTIWSQGAYVEMVTLLAIFVTLIDLIHLTAWNFAFPTRTELIMWRVAALASVSIPAVPLLLLYPFTYLWSWIASRVNKASKDSIKMKARRFRAAVVWAMRDYDPLEENPEIKEAMRKLETYEEGERYRDIFNPDLAKDLNESIQVMEGNRSAFARDFDWLTKIIRDPDSTAKKANRSNFARHFNWLTRITCCMNGTANVDPEIDPLDLVEKFPLLTHYERVRRVRARITKLSMPLVTFAYIASRFITIYLAFSSLRAMPDSVYQATWTRFIPFLQ